GLAEAGNAFEQDMASGGQRDDGVAEEGFLADNQAGQLGLERLRQLGHLACVDARFFGDHVPPWRDLSGGTLFTELREILADEVALTSGDEALIGGIDGRLPVGLDHLGVGAQRHLLSRAKRRRIILGLARHRLPRNVDPLRAGRARAASGPRTVGPRTAGSAGSAVPVSAAVPVSVAIPIPVAIPRAAAARAGRGTGTGVRLSTLAVRIAVGLRRQLPAGGLEAIDRRGDGLVRAFLLLQRIELARHIVEGLGGRGGVTILQRRRRLAQGIPHPAVLRLLRCFRQRPGELFAVFG